MIDGLIGGKLYGKPAQRVGQSGKPFVTAKVRTPTAEGDALFVNVIAFDKGVCDALLALQEGDSVSLSGVLTPKVWTHNGEARAALDMVAHAALTAYNINRKRQVVKGEQKPRQDSGPTGLDDGLPWED